MSDLRDVNLRQVCVTEKVYSNRLTLDFTLVSKMRNKNQTKILHNTTPLYSTLQVRPIPIFDTAWTFYLN